MNLNYLQLSAIFSIAKSSKSFIFLADSATATLSISPRKVRQINDPILQFLNQLHKIIYITQVRQIL